MPAPAAVLAVLIAVSAGAAPPQVSPEATRKKVQSYLLLAADLFKTGDFEGSLAELRRAQGLEDLAVVRFNIARCLEELGRAEEALTAFEFYLQAQDSTENAGVNQQRAKDAIARHEGALFGTLEIACQPEGAQLKIPPVAPAPVPCPFSSARVKPGTYQVTASRPGGLEISSTVKVEAGKRAQATLLVPEAPPPPPPPPSAAKPDEKPAPGDLSIAASVEGATVRVLRGGTTQTGAVPFTARELAPGTYLVEVSAPDGRLIAGEARVSSGLLTRLRATFHERGEAGAPLASELVPREPAPAPAPAPAAAVARAPASSSGGPSGKLVGGAALVALGGVALGGCAVLAVLGEGEKASIKNGGLASGQAIQDAAARGTLEYQLSAGAAGLGVAAAAVGAILLVLDRSSGPYAIGPQPVPGGLGLAVSGSLP